ncbi:MAG: response regulator [Desulfobulbaceae bacterium]|nr:response regulator [Desulfobulbaceae bacterium]
MSEEIVRDLREQVRLLTLENKQLIDRAEDIFLLGLVAEKVAAENDPDRLIVRIFEQISLLKGVALCLFGHAHEHELTITHSYSTMPGFSELEYPVSTTLSYQFPANNHLCTAVESETAKGLLGLLFPALTLTVNSVLCLGRRRVDGQVVILILADDRRPEELALLEPLVTRVVDIVMARLDTLVLQDSLRAANRDLEEKVNERTKELLRLNQALTAEINERRKTEEALHSREYLYRTLVDSLPMGVSVISRDHRINMVNRMYADWFGRSAESFGDKICHEQFEQRDSPCAHCPGVVSMETGGIAHAETEGVRQDGSRFAVRIRTVPLHNGELTPSGFIEVVEDITELKRAAEESDSLNKKMLQVQKLESLGVLAGGIAHDFNNILMAILGHAELTKLMLPATTPVRDNLLQIEQAAQKAAALSRQMLAYSGRGKFVIETVDVAELVRDMVHMLEVSISKKALLRYNFASDLPPVEVDATQIRQVMMNLVINASEAIGDRSGIIAITTGAMMVDRSYLAKTWFDEGLREGLYVFIEVADTGCGMDQETMKRVFDPFFTTKFTGRGLGMAAVLGIVRGHQGSMKIYSELGKGSSFKVLLPASPEYAQQMRKTAPVEMLTPGNGTILLVDDEETLRALGQEMLELLGYQVVTAEDGRHALEKFKEYEDEIVAVLLDLTMPHMDGEEAFRELRRIRSDVKVVMCSGYNEQEVSQRFIGKGLAGFVQKPYTLKALGTILHEVVLSAKK